jgi:acyl-ACP thioesterase
VTAYGIGDDRRVRLTQKVRLGDVTPRGRLRLDAVARYLQDIATDDGDDAALPAGTGWILRRVDLVIGRLPALREELGLETYCTGLGRGARWAERTTTITDAAGVTAVTGRAVWVYVDLASGAPRALPPEFLTVYGEAVRDRRVSARLTLPRCEAGTPRSPWSLRRTDIDVYGHMNNANYWAPVEEWLGGPGAGRRIVGATVEFGSGISPDDACTLAVADAGADVTWWFLVDGETRATASVRFAGP